MARRTHLLVFDVEARAGDVVLERGRVFRALVEHGKFDARAKAWKQRDQ